MKVTLMQTTSPKAWAGVTLKSHLGAIWQQDAQLASKITTKMLATAYGNTLDTMLEGIPALYMDSSDDYTWSLIGSAERNIPLVAAYTDSLLTTPVTAADYNVGIGGSDIYLVFPERWFSDVNVIVGEKNELYPFQILEDPYADGTNFVYRARLYGSSALQSGVPGEELVANKLFSKDYSPVSDTLSVKGGDVGYTAPITMRNGFSQIRMQYTAPGNMSNHKFGAVFQEQQASGEVKSFTTWVEYQDWVFEHQFAQEKNRLLYYGRSNRDLNGRFTSVDRGGHVIRAGGGIREQMETTNTRTFNSFNITDLTDMLSDLAEGKLAMDQRSFVIRTGERGAIMISEAIKRETSGWTPLFDETAMGNVSSNLHSNAKSFGFQFTEFKAPNNINVRVEVDPMYSDPVRNKIAAPNNGYYRGGLAESYRMDILDIGTIQGEPNIRKVYSKKDPDLTRYIPGIRHPFSPTGEKMQWAVTPKDGYEVHKMATCSAMIKDPGRTASFIPSILAY